VSKGRWAWFSSRGNPYPRNRRIPYKLWNDIVERGEIAWNCFFAGSSKWLPQNPFSPGNRDMKKVETVIFPGTEDHNPPKEFLAGHPNKHLIHAHHLERARKAVLFMLHLCPHCDIEGDMKEFTEKYGGHTCDRFPDNVNKPYFTPGNIDCNPTACSTFLVCMYRAIECIIKYCCCPDEEDCEVCDTNYSLTITGGAAPCCDHINGAFTISPVGPSNECEWSGSHFIPSPTPVALSFSVSCVGTEKGARWQLSVGYCIVYGPCFKVGALIGTIVASTCPDGTYTLSDPVGGAGACSGTYTAVIS
jgi:hypothetical protein